MEKVEDPAPPFADAVTRDVYNRVLNPASVRAVSGLAMYAAMRRMDILMSVPRLEDLKFFRNLVLAQEPGGAQSIAMHGAIRLHFRWDQRPLPANRRPRSPGEVIVTEFLEPLKRTQQELADALGVDRVRMNGVIRGRRCLTVDTALRLEKVLGPSAQFWLTLQHRIDLWNELQKPRVAESLEQLSSLTGGRRKRGVRNPAFKFGYGRNPWHVSDRIKAPMPFAADAPLDEDGFDV